MAIEIVRFPIKTFIYEGFSMAMLNNQMVIVHVARWFQRSGGYPFLPGGIFSTRENRGAKKTSITVPT